MIYNEKEAYEFYHLLLNSVKVRRPYYKKHQISMEKMVSSFDWECFGAILVNDQGNGPKGADLQRHEVKSAKVGSSFEYQYHRDTAMEKFAGDCSVDHVFVSYAGDYRSISVRLVSSDLIAPVLESWQPLIERNYESQDKQRCRHSLSYKFVRENGLPIFRIDEEKITHFNECLF